MGLQIKKAPQKSKTIMRKPTKIKNELKMRIKGPTKHKMKTKNPQNFVAYPVLTFDVALFEQHFPFLAVFFRTIITILEQISAFSDRELVFVISPQNAL